MKYIITENKLDNVVIKYLNKMYGDLEEYRINKHPDSVYFVKGKKVYMEHNSKRELLYVDYDTIWKDLTDTFLLEYDEIQSIITKWAEETYNLRYVTPHEQLPIAKIRWDRLIK